MEEYVARQFTDEPDLFFMWQVRPSVIFGRNQLIENEVNLDYCRQNGIETYRRKSGGGCVYADMTNVMLSYITSSDSVSLTYNRYINMVVLVLRRLGVEARSTGRNDVIVDGRKLSGNAFYHLPGRSIVHGTMLYDTDMEHMVRAITPSSEKLVSKGVESVRQRVALLKDYVSISLDEFKQFVRENLCDGELLLTPADVETIGRMEQEYLSPDFILGRNPRYTVVRRRRIEGVGEIEARMELKNGVVKDLNLVGDYFLVGDLDALLRRLRGVRLEREALSQVLPQHLEDIILHLRRDDLIDLLAEESTRN
jgi:lipoyltransferase/lipoate-protein ligase